MNKAIHGLLLAGLVACTSAIADEAARKDKIAAIMQAQGLHQMFQQQLDQGLASANDMGRSVVGRIAQESGMPEADAKAKLEPIFLRYMERCAKMFSARELVEIWARSYGRDLSDRELDQVLAYYRSPVGKKEVASSQKAMEAFAQTMNSLGQERLNELMGQLMRDLKEAARK